MTELKTSRELIAAIERAASTSTGPDELHRQRVSFIMGSLDKDSTVTKERIEREIARNEGRIVR